MRKLSFVNGFFYMLTVFRIISILILPITSSPFVKLMNDENIYRILMLIFDLIGAIVAAILDSRPPRSGAGGWLLLTSFNGYISKLTGNYMWDSFLWIVIIFTVYILTDKYLFNKRHASNTNNQEPQKPDTTVINEIALSFMVILASSSFMFLVFKEIFIFFDVNWRKMWQLTYIVDILALLTMRVRRLPELYEAYVYVLILGGVRTLLLIDMYENVLIGCIYFFGSFMALMIMHILGSIKQNKIEQSNREA